jgi:hypothetical protein
MKNKAYIVHSTGKKVTFHPKFTQYDTETQQFAKLATQAMRNGGVSIAISHKVNIEALREASLTLQLLYAEASLRAKQEEQDSLDGWSS